MTFRGPVPRSRSSASSRWEITGSCLERNRGIGSQYSTSWLEIGGGEGDRTPGPLLAKQVLSR